MKKILAGLGVLGLLGAVTIKAVAPTRAARMDTVSVTTVTITRFNRGAALLGADTSVRQVLATIPVPVDTVTQVRVEHRTDTLTRLRVDTLNHTDTLTKVRVDTVTKVRVDTVRIPAPPPPPAPTPPAPPPSPVPAPVPPAPPPAPSPTPPPVGLYPHEPAGMTWNNTRRFDAVVENGWGNRGDAAFSIVQDATAPISPPNVGQALYAPSLPSGSGPINTWLTLPPGMHTLYVCYWLKVSPNWTATSQVTKQVFFLIGAAHTTRVYSGLSGIATMGPVVDFQGMDVTGGHPISWNGYPNLNLAAAVIPRGQWVKWEILLVANMPGVFNGTADFWLNGVHVGSYNTVGYTQSSETGAGNTWQGVMWNPTWGGAGVNGPNGGHPPADQFIWFDHFYVSAKP